MPVMFLGTATSDPGKVVLTDPNKLTCEAAQPSRPACIFSL
jgi:hypothetical protein